MTATTASGASYSLRERGGSFIEIPLGVGVSWRSCRAGCRSTCRRPRRSSWASAGDVFDDAQTVDPGGHLRNVGPMPLMDASLVQTIGLSLLL